MDLLKNFDKVCVDSMLNILCIGTVADYNRRSRMLPRYDAGLLSTGCVCVCLTEFKLNPSSHFTNDLGLDSLDTVEVVMAIEEVSACATGFFRLR